MATYLRLFGESTLPPQEEVFHPPCFDDDEDWAIWLLQARRSRSLAPVSYCEDCDLVTQKIMIDASRCAHPETTFHTFRKKLEDGTIEDEVLGVRVMTNRRRTFVVSPDGEPPV